MIRQNPLLVIILFAFTLGFTACGEDDEIPTVPVIGTITDNLADDPDFSSLVAALQRTGQDNFIDGPTARLTVFAPNDAAFAAAGIDLSTISDEELADILAYHVLVGQVLRDGDIAEGRSEYATRNDQGPGGANIPITIDNSGGSYTINGMTNVTAGPTEAVNGVYYVIDGILMPPTLVDRAALNGNFTTLISALERVGLDATLSAAGDYTVFAPTDDAFAASGINLATVSDKVLSELLMYHVLGMAVAAGDIPAGQSFQTTLSTEGPDSTNLSLMISNTDSVTINNQAEVVVPDVFGTNGVIHAIDDVLEMQSIVDFVLMSNQLDSLRGALTAVDLVDDLMGEGPFTVFAPVNAAFTAAADTIATLDADMLEEVLLYHVSLGNVTSDELMDEMDVTTLNGGQTFMISMEEDQAPMIVVSDSTEVGFINTDIQGTNGVVHLVNGVLLPDLDN